MLLIRSRIPTGLKIQAWGGDQAHITDIMRDMQITPSQPRQHQEKGQEQLSLQNGYIRGRGTRAKGRAGNGTHQTVQWPPSKQTSLYPLQAPETANVNVVKKKEGNSDMYFNLCLPSGSRKAERTTSIGGSVS